MTIKAHEINLGDALDYDGVLLRVLRVRRTSYTLPSGTAFPALEVMGTVTDIYSAPYSPDLGKSACKGRLWYVEVPVTCAVNVIRAKDL